jgi:outer membrane protein, multidrug efflux system
MSAASKILVAGLVVSLLPGCTVGPDYKRPDVPVPSELRGLPADRIGDSEVASFADEKWWEAFQDETLRELIRIALRQNYDARIAGVRILEARAELGITRADELPALSGQAAAARERLPQQPGLPAGETSAYQAGLSLSWELDFWGKFRRATESARASLLAQEWARRQVLSSLVSDVAIAYFQLRELDLELEISRQTLATRKDSLELTRLLADRGATSQIDVYQAEQLVFGAQAAIPDLERRIEQQENFISVLLGENPRSIARGRKLVDQPHPVEVPAGLPSSLLERRPDILLAEQQLIAANAQIGVAKADFFPHISLTGQGGFQSSALSNLFEGPAGLWSIGGSLFQSIFDGGRIRNRVELAEARTEEAGLFYQQSVLLAFRDVSDSLVGYRKSQEVRFQQQQLTHSAEEATQLSSMRYKGGYPRAGPAPRAPVTRADLPFAGRRLGAVGVGSSTCRSTESRSAALRCRRDSSRCFRCSRRPRSSGSGISATCAASAPGKCCPGWESRARGCS